MACGPCIISSFLVHLVAYFAILALLVIISCVILKCIGEWRVADLEEGGEGESSHLLPPSYVNKTITVNYGTCQHDIESGNCSSSSNSGNSKCSEELYDPKVCVICYDQRRNCFFVPCGHCATCRVCAERIFFKENRNCPVCRRFIGKIRRLFSS